ncbi:MAG: HAMP domain-containing histidine kinase [Bacteroidales bacterium]|nr:HAMP domain-containing histidine kinase [Bacteroidales bacterium]
MNSAISNNTKQNLEKEIERFKLQLAIKENEVSLLKNKFFSNISHEIRTPMNVIVGFTNLLSDPTYGEDQKKFFIDEINFNSKKLLRIIDNLILASQIDSDELNLNMSMHKVSQIFQDIRIRVKNNEQFNKNKNLKLIAEFEKTGQDVHIFTDKAKLIDANMMILESLLLSIPAQTIFYGASVSQSHIEFFVREDFTTERNKKLNKIYKAIRQESNTTEVDETNPGIGLIVSSKIIRSLGGKLNVKSIPDKESSFYFTIPLLVEKPV